MASKKEKEKKKIRYSTAKERAEKHEAATSNTSKALKIPKDVLLMTKFKGKGIVKMDILPYFVGKGNPMCDADEEGKTHFERTYWVHGQVGPDNETHTCLKQTFHKPCPICEHMSDLRRKGADWEAIKEWKPKERQLFNFIDVTNETEKAKGVQVFDFNHWQFGKIIDSKRELSDDEDNYDGFYHLTGGQTLKIHVVEESFMGKPNFKPETIDFKPRPDYDESIIDDTYCLDEFIQETPYKKLKEIFMAMAAPADKDEDEDDDIPPKGRKTTSHSPPDDEDDEDEDEDSDLEDEDEEEVKPAKSSKAKHKFKVGDHVMYKKLECQITKISADGKLITIEDESEEDYRVNDASLLSLIEEEEDDAPTSTVRSKKKNLPKDEPDEDDDEDTDDDDDSDEDGDEDEDDEDEEDEEPEPPKKRGRPKK